MSVILFYSLPFSKGPSPLTCRAPLIFIWSNLKKKKAVRTIINNIKTANSALHTVHCFGKEGQFWSYLDYEDNLKGGD